MVKLELCNSDGKILDQEMFLPRSGPVLDPGEIRLPVRSAIEIDLSCNGWGVPSNAIAMISTSDAAWVITDEQRGNIFIRGTIARQSNWVGEINTPLVNVEWSD